MIAAVIRWSIQNRLLITLATLLLAAGDIAVGRLGRVFRPPHSARCLARPVRRAGDRQDQLSRPSSAGGGKPSHLPVGDGFSGGAGRGIGARLFWFRRFLRLRDFRRRHRFVLGAVTGAGISEPDCAPFATPSATGVRPRCHRRWLDLRICLGGSDGPSRFGATALFAGLVPQIRVAVGGRRGRSRDGRRHGQAISGGARCQPAARLQPAALASADGDSERQPGSRWLGDRNGRGRIHGALARLSANRRGLQTVEDLRRVSLGVSSAGTPILLGDVAEVRIGPQLRLGAAELDGEGEVVGGIIVMRSGENALTTIDAVKAKLEQLRRGLPEGVEIVPTYDRSSLILRAVANLRDKLVEEFVVVVVVCALFLFHLRSSLVILISLPVGILAAFAIMRWQGINANILSLGGIAIAIGAMVDAAIVMVENLHKHLEHAQLRDAADRWRIVQQASAEVGPPLFFSLLIITFSFLPVFSLEAQEGRLFAPLAYTKTYAMAAAAGLSITLVPVLMGWFVRGRILPENKNPLNRLLIAIYRPFVGVVLRRPWLVVVLAGLLTVVVLAGLLTLTGWWPLHRLGVEFMPDLDEGDLLYMPTTFPAIAIGKATEILQQTGKLIRTVPEVQRVFGKVGRAETATDPAPLSMIETAIELKPRAEWRPGLTTADLIAELDRIVKLPGLSNAWVMPIKNRINMLATGIKTPLGVKVAGTDPATIQQVGERLEQVIRTIPGATSVYSERVAGGRYVDIVIGGHRHRPLGRCPVGIERRRRARGHQHRRRRDECHRDRGGAGTLSGQPALSASGARLVGAVAGATYRDAGRRRGAVEPSRRDQDYRWTGDVTKRERPADWHHLRGHSGPRHRFFRRRGAAGGGGASRAAGWLFAALVRPVRVFDPRLGQAANCRADHAGDHLSAAVSEFRPFRSSGAHHGDLAFCAAGRNLVAVLAELQPVGGGRGRLHRPSRRRGGNRGGDVGLSRSGVGEATGIGRQRRPRRHFDRVARGGDRRRAIAGAAENDDRRHHHRRLVADHVRHRDGIGSDASHRCADGGWHGQRHAVNSGGDSGSVPDLAEGGDRAKEPLVKSTTFSRWRQRIGEPANCSPDLAAVKILAVIYI